MKGQIFSMDLMISLVIFFSVIAIVMYFWFIVPTFPEYNLIEKANSIGNYLTTSKLGFESMLKCSLITNLAAKDYDVIKEELNVGPYDMWITFSNTSNICGGGKTTLGEQFTNTTYAAAIFRIVHVDDQKMRMNVVIYD